MSGAKSVDAGARSVPSPKPSEASKPQGAEKASRSDKADKPDQGQQARAARNADSFDAAPSQKKAKVELNPSAPPANSNVEAAKKPDQAQAAADADATRRDQMNAELQKTGAGRQAQQDVQRSGAKVDFEDGNKSYFDPSQNRVVIGRDQSPQDASAAFVNESVHAGAWADGRTANPAAMSRGEYVDGMVKEEARSSAAEIEHRRELAAQGGPQSTGTTALDKQYDDAYRGAVASGLSADAAKDAGRAAVLQGVRDGSAVAGVSGQKYGDYYAEQYDRVASGEITAAQVKRSDDSPPPLQNPQKIGVVLNAQPQDLPEGKTLQDAGVRAARITLTAEQLQINKDAKLPADDAKLDPAKMEILKNKLADYRARGIEVTANLPPELVNGKPEFSRTGGKYLWSGDAVRLQESQLNDVDGPTWEAYQKDHVQRTTELATALKDSVDNWEISNEPDATERVFIRGYQDVKPGDPEGTVYPDQVYMTDPDGKQQPIKGVFDPGLPPNRYGQLLNTEYDVIKSIDTGRPDPSDPTKTVGNNVLTAGLVSGDAEHSIYHVGDPSYLEQAMNQNGGVLHFDGISVHPYNKNDQASFKATVDNYARFAREDLGRPDVKIYVTEASPGPMNKDNPDDHKRYVDYIDALAPETDQNDNVARTYFFWDGTFDGHTGLVQMPEAQQQLQHMLGK